MRLRRGKNGSQADPPPAPAPVRAFAWPSRAHAAAAAAAADRAAEEALLRIHSRVPQAAAEAPAPDPPEARPPEAPAPWERSFDETADRLIADLRRDLGPSAGA